MAGVQSLINQATRSAQGNPNFTYYRLASHEYGHAGNPACDASLGNASDANCIFHDITLGDNDAVCSSLVYNGSTIGTFNCFYPAIHPGTYGVLSTSNSSYQPAFRATPGYDFATGIGSINAYNLVANWPGSRLATSAKR